MMKLNQSRRKLKILEKFGNVQTSALDSISAIRGMHAGWAPFVGFQGGYGSASVRRQRLHA